MDLKEYQSKLEGSNRAINVEKSNSKFGKKKRSHQSQDVSQRYTVIVNNKTKSILMESRQKPSNKRGLSKSSQKSKKVAMEYL